MNRIHIIFHRYCISTNICKYLRVEITMTKSRTAIISSEMIVGVAHRTNDVLHS